MGELVVFPGVVRDAEPPPGLTPVKQDVVRALEMVLEAAKRGEVEAVAIISPRSDGTVHTTDIYHSHYFPLVAGVANQLSKLTSESR